MYVMKERYIHFMSEKRKMISLGLIRILFGCLLLYSFLSVFKDRYVFFGENGFFPIEKVKNHSEFITRMIHSIDALNIITFILLTGAIASITYIIGFEIKISGIYLYVCYFYLESRNPIIFDWGEVFLRFSILYMLFCDLSFFSLDRYLKKKKQKHIKQDHPISIAIHNYAVIALIVQYLYVYFFAGLAKTQGVLWQEGTAIYYMSSLDFFNAYPFISAIFMSHEWIYKSVTYFNIVFQLVFPFLIFVRKVRWLMFFLAFGFHVAVYVHFAVAIFALIMFFFEFIFFSDDELRSFKQTCVSYYQRFKQNKTA